VPAALAPDVLAVTGLDSAPPVGTPNGIAFIIGLRIAARWFIDRGTRYLA
jgi:hypothetical protein